MRYSRLQKEKLEERLVDFAVTIINISEQLSGSKAGTQMANQIIRSGTSVALNYGEAQDAESKNDFIHKIKRILKELRETLVCLKIIKKTNILKKDCIVLWALNECNELISIFVRSVDTARKKSI